MVTRGKGKAKELRKYFFFILDEHLKLVGSCFWQLGKRSPKTKEKVKEPVMICPVN